MFLVTLAFGAASAATCIVGGAAATHATIQSALNTAACTAIDARVTRQENLVSTRAADTRIFSTTPGTQIDGGGVGVTLTVLGTGLVTVDGVDIINGSGALGGGVYVGVGARVFLEGLTLSGNDAVDGGGAYADGELILQDVLATGNAATGNGGAVYMSATASGGLRWTDVEGNEAGDDGGGVYFASNDSYLHHSFIGSNIAGNDGGGAWISGIGTPGTASLTIHDTFYDNVAGQTGGGVYVADGTLSIRTSTVTGNSAAVGGGVGVGPDARLVLFTATNIYNDATDYRDLYALGDVWMLSSIVGNDGAHPGGVEDCWLGDGSFTLASVDGDGTCTGFTLANYGLTADPAQGVWRPSAASALRAALPLELCPDDDQLGRYRSGAGCEPGAMEY